MIFKTIDRDQASKTIGKAYSPDVGRYNPNKPLPKVPCFVALKADEIEKDRLEAFMPKPQYELNPEVSCAKLNH